MFASDRLAHAARGAAVAAGLLMCAVLHAGQNAAVVKEVIYLGAKHASPQALSRAAGLHPGMSMEPDLNKQACQKIAGYYHEHGRPFAGCELIEGTRASDSRIIFDITEGPKVRVSRIEFRGNHFVSDRRLATHVESRAETGTMNLQTADADARRLEGYYRSLGFKEARVSHELQVMLDFSKVILVFHIEEGRRSRPKEADQTKPGQAEVDADAAPPR